MMEFYNRELQRNSNEKSRCIAVSLAYPIWVTCILCPWICSALNKLSRSNPIRLISNLYASQYLACYMLSQVYLSCIVLNFLYLLSISRGRY